jgi:N-acetylmuramoyl-L-alanine amidase/Mannosyl-glycoprotein endo-beta-N-acetylglucosaminidase
MGRIVISAGHGGLENGLADPGAIVAGTTESREMIAIRDALVAELRSRKLEVLIVPDDLSLAQTIDWINSRVNSTDVALEIHAGASNNTALKGATIFYIADNEPRKGHAALLIKALRTKLPELDLQGILPDTTNASGRITFCRQVKSPSLLLEIAMLTNPIDRGILQTQRAQIAQGLADGLVAWNHSVSGIANPSPISTGTYEAIKIRLNGQTFGEQGILVNGNAYIPIGLVNRFGIDISTERTLTRLEYRNVMFVRAVDLRNFNLTIGWDHPNRTVIVQSILRICPGTIDLIMGHGHTSKEQLNFLLSSKNPDALKHYPDLANRYREEGSIEGVNYDIAFCQMCLETDFLRFSGVVQASQNNFAGMSNEKGDSASFSSAQFGVRAHIQRLKKFASQEKLVQENVDPRSGFNVEGLAPLVSQMVKYWPGDPKAKDKAKSKSESKPESKPGSKPESKPEDENEAEFIMGLLRQLYESAQLLT